MAAALIYLLCALMSLGIAVMLWRAFARTHSRLLYWSALCFSGLSLNNLLLVLDKLVLSEADLSGFRQAIALISLVVLVFGLVYEDE
jgi:hypothetical protein